MGSKSKQRGTHGRDCGDAFGSAGCMRHNARLADKRMLKHLIKRKELDTRAEVTIKPYVAPKLNIFQRFFRGKDS